MGDYLITLLHLAFSGLCLAVVVLVVSQAHVCWLVQEFVSQIIVCVDLVRL